MGGFVVEYVGRVCMCIGVVGERVDGYSSRWLVGGLDRWVGECMGPWVGALGWVTWF